MVSWYSSVMVSYVQQRINFFQIAAIYLFVIYLVVDLAVYLRTSLKPLQPVM